MEKRLDLATFAATDGQTASKIRWMKECATETNIRIYNREYQDGRFTANALVEIMKGFKNQPPSASAAFSATEWELIEEPVPGGKQSWPTLDETKGGGKSKAAPPKVGPTKGHQTGKGSDFGTGGKSDGKKISCLTLLAIAISLAFQLEECQLHQVLFLA